MEGAARRSRRTVGEAMIRGVGTGGDGSKSLLEDWLRLWLGVLIGANIRNQVPKSQAGGDSYIGVFVG